MAEFDESKVINALHTERAEIGKRYYCADNIIILKEYAEENSENSASVLTEISPTAQHHPFICGGCFWSFLYPREEPPKQRMTNRQLAEWLAKGNGEGRHLSSASIGIFTHCAYLGESNDECLSDLRIRSWNSDVWVEPTVDVYERDCK